jgi:4-hydroxybenzoate polyprenyltransferase
VEHVVTFALFVWFGALVGLGWLWWIGLALTAAAFVYEHAIVRADDLSRVNRAFFTANGFVGIVLFVFALADLVLRLGLR